METINYLAQIEHASLDLAEVQREAATLRERLAEIESLLTLKIANAKSPEGKPLYSNAATRTAELVLRLRGCADAKQIKELLTRADERRARRSAQQEGLRGEFKLHLLDRQAEITHGGASLIA